MTLSKAEEFKSLCARAGACGMCPNLAAKKAVLSGLNGELSPKVLFVAEAPGRQGGDRTRRPFYGDKSGANFQILLDSIGLRREQIFITNSILCSPRSETGANRKPTRVEIRNCSGFLRETIDLIDPPVVVTLGSVALEAIKVIEPHSLTLKTSAGKPASWNARILVPLYHPSPQVVAAQRGLETQIRHFQELGKILNSQATWVQIPAAPDFSGHKRSSRRHRRHE